MNLKEKISSGLAIAALLLLALFLGNLKYQQYRDQRQIEQQKQNLQQQADALQKKNNQLTQSLEYLNSTDFKESVARQQLDLKKEGEQVYSFSNAAETAASGAEAKGSNFKKWWSYFFNN